MDDAIKLICINCGLNLNKKIDKILLKFKRSQCIFLIILMCNSFNFSYAMSVRLIDKRDGVKSYIPYSYEFRILSTNNQNWC